MIPTITLPLKEYVELLVACRGDKMNRDYAIIGESKSKEINATPDFQEICHLESMENSLFKLWSIKDWQASESRRAIVKANSIELKSKMDAKSLLRIELLSRIMKAYSVGEDVANIIRIRLLGNKDIKSLSEIFNFNNDEANLIINEDVPTL